MQTSLIMHGIVGIYNVTAELTGPGNVGTDPSWTTSDTSRLCNEHQCRKCGVGNTKLGSLFSGKTTFSVLTYKVYHKKSFKKIY